MRRRTAVVAALSLAACSPPAPALAAEPASASVHSSAAARHGVFDLQAHRGGLALRPESTLAAFGNALRLGVRTLELDVQITADGAAVVTHDRKVDGTKCVDTAPATPGDRGFPYVGKYVNTLTLAQVRTLDCGSSILPRYPDRQLVPGARMPTLREVFDLVTRYRADDVMLNIETKVEAAAPHETAPREQFVQITAREIRAAGFTRRVTVQSFDWGALTRMREVEPRLRRVALVTPNFLEAGMPGASPWLGGLDIDDFGGDPVRAAKSLGVAAISPVHGGPQNTGAGDPGYVPYTTKEMVERAHRLGMAVVPWTVNDAATMTKLIDDGVDGIITDEPDRLRQVMGAKGLRLPRAYESPFDIQGHRGARAVRPENTLAAFRYALADPDVSTLELDTGVTADKQVIVLHDRTINGSHCIDTAPAVPGDPQYPYVGKLVRSLTLAQLKTLDCGSRTLPGFPNQVPVPGERIPTLAEVFALVKASGRTDMRLNVETKLSPVTPEDTVPYDEFTRRVVREIQRASFTGRTTIQSFDWRTIMLSRELDRRIGTVALVWQYGPAECATLADECSLQALYGDPSVKSPWTGGLDWWQRKDLGALTRQAGAGTVSANWQVHDPQQPKVVSDDWYLRRDPAYFHGPRIDVLHRRYGLKVVPYTLNDDASMQRAIDLGVDGLISDDPALAVVVARRNGLR